MNVMDEFEKQLSEILKAKAVELQTLEQNFKRADLVLKATYFGTHPNSYAYYIDLSKKAFQKEAEELKLATEETSNLALKKLTELKEREVLINSTPQVRFEKALESINLQYEAALKEENRLYANHREQVRKEVSGPLLKHRLSETDDIWGKRKRDLNEEKERALEKVEVNFARRTTPTAAQTNKYPSPFLSPAPRPSQKMFRNVGGY
jgi:hypothetical protein